MKQLEVKELQYIAEILKNDICKEYDLKDIKIKVKKLKRGHARMRSRLVSIPYWAYYHENLNYFKYYVLHELSHFINRDIHKSDVHGAMFKYVEKTALNKYNMVPIYKKVYVKELKNNKGDTIWKRWEE